MKLQELFSDSSKWTKEAYARDKDGNKVWFNDNNAVCFCLSGGIKRCYVSNSYIIYNKIMEHLLDNISDIVTWNDAPERTFEDIQKLCKELDI